MDITGAQNIERGGDQEDKGAWVPSGSWAVIPDEDGLYNIHRIKGGH